MLFRSTLLLTFFILTLLSCRREDGDPVSSNNINTVMVKTAIAGNVTDVNGEPIENVVIQIEGKSVKTTQYGTFFIEEVLVPKDRCTISCEKEGFFKGFKSSPPKENNITEFKVVLTGMQKRFFDSNKENTTKVGESQIVFPANGYVYSDGTSYSGTVTAALGYLDPSTPNFYAQFSGDMTARRNDGSETELYSFGVFRVELFDDNNKPLNLGNGKKASLYYPIAEFQEAHAPEKMPLWFFDETKNIWQEEGEVQRKGNVYVGSVSHFTSWNCDIPTRTTFLSGKILCHNITVKGVEVRIGERTVISDDAGFYRVRVPTGIVFPIEVIAERNNGITSTKEYIGPFTSQSENNHTINLSGCPGIVTGKVQCEGSPRGATIVVEYPNGKTTSLFTLTGSFSGQITGNSDFRIFAVSSSGRQSKTKEFSKTENSGFLDCGVLDVCMNASEPKEYWDLAVPFSYHYKYLSARANISSDGSRICIVQQSTYSDNYIIGDCFVIDVVTGLKLYEIPIGSNNVSGNDLCWSTDDRYLAIRTSNGVFVYDGFSGKEEFKQTWSPLYWKESEENMKVAFTLNNTCVAYYDPTSNAIKIYNIETDKLVKNSNRPKDVGGMDVDFTFLGINNEAEIIEYSYGKNEVSIIEQYDLNSMSVIGTTTTSIKHAYVNSVEIFSFNGNRVCMIDVWMDGVFFYIIGQDKPFKVYDTPFKNTLVSSRRNGKNIFQTSDNNAHLLDFPSLEPIRSYPLPKLSSTYFLTSSSSGNRFALVYQPDTIIKVRRVRVWDTD